MLYNSGPSFETWGTPNEARNRFSSEILMLDADGRFRHRIAEHKTNGVESSQRIHSDARQELLRHNYAVRVPCSVKILAVHMPHRSLQLASCKY